MYIHVVSARRICNYTREILLEYRVVVYVVTISSARTDTQMQCAKKKYAASVLT